ncbi:MAG: hypothetical protein WA228_05650, partial [Desulfobaccales bacterium]
AAHKEPGPRQQGRQQPQGVGFLYPHGQLITTIGFQVPKKLTSFLWKLGFEKIAPCYAINYPLKMTDFLTPLFQRVT